MALKLKAPKGVNRFLDRFGNVRTYLRRDGFPNAKLPNDCMLWSPQMLAAIDAIVNGDATVIAVAAVKVGAGLPGSLDDATVAWFACPAFGMGKEGPLGQASMDDRKRALNRFRNVVMDNGKRRGTMPFVTLTGELVDKLLLTLKPHEQRHLLDALKPMCAWCVKEKRIAVDPTAGRKPARPPKAKGATDWPEEDIALYRASYPLGTRERVALEVLLNIGARRDDARKIGSQSIRDGRIVFTPSKTANKTGKIVSVKMADALAEALAALPVRPVRGPFITQANGKPYESGSGFYNWFRASCLAIGLTDHSPHGLRKAAARRVAEFTNGSVTDIMAVLGHSTAEEAIKYSEAFNRTYGSDRAVDAFNARNAEARP